MMRAAVAAVAAACVLCSSAAWAAPVVVDGQTYLYEHARVPADQATPLDKYVAAPDKVYAWRDTNTTFSSFGYTAHLLNLTSCAWLSAAEVGDASVWTHQLLVIVPTTIKDHTTAALWITGGENGSPKPPKATDEDVIVASALATGANVIAASLFQVPNQPIYYADDPLHDRRIEDAMIAFGWNKFIDTVNNGTTPNPQYLARLPMTKSAVRAMDAVTAWAAQSPVVAAAVERGIAEGRNAKVASGADTETAAGPSNFIVAGASKRGWTTWTTAAVDKRVIAMIPIVMDALHVTKFMHSMFQSYGGWSFALVDYYALNITTKFDTPGHTALEAIVDPAAYMSRFTMPKLVVDATGDEFFMQTDDADWWADMPEPKARLMIQNAEHSLATGVVEVLQGAVAWANAQITKETVPTMTWNISADSSTITMTASTAPSKVTHWFAKTTSTARRDFRLLTGVKPCPGITVKGACLNLYFYNKTTLAPVKGSTTSYAATVPVPAKGEGWMSHFLEVEWPSSLKKDPFLFTSQAAITPVGYPFPDCKGAQCRGTLT